MTFKAASRVYETSVTTGTGTYTLDGAAAGFQSFSSGIGANNYCEYVATDDTNWEIVRGQMLSGPNRLTRDTILASSNGGAAVNWGAGTRKLRCMRAGERDFPVVKTVSIAGGAGTQVLTQEEQRCDILILTGALTGNRTIEVDATPWAWVVYNNTSGAFTATLKVNGQTGIAVTQGKRTPLHNDGVDVRPSTTEFGGAASEFAAGTPMLFGQTTAPIGWTKSTTHNNKALRVVSGTAGSGGATAFTSVFGAGKSAGGYTLALADIPSHTHTVGLGLVGGGVAGTYEDTGNTSAINSGTAGGGGSHAHTLSLDLQYVDVIIATKD